MKRLLATAALLLPLWISAQGFGIFSRDLPFLAGSVSSEPSGPACDFGDWNPALTNTSLLALYDFNCLQQSDGSAITSITNSASISFLLQPCFTTNYPYYSNNVSEINNRGYGYFDGVDDNLQNGNGTLYGTTNTVFLVSQLQTTTNVAVALFDNGHDVTLPGGYEQMLFCGSGSGYALSQSTVGDEANIGPYAAHTNWVVTEVYFNSASSYVKTNGVTAASGTLPPSKRTGLTLGGRRNQGDNIWNANVKIAWAAVFTNTLSSTESSNVFYYLTNRFSLP